MKNQVNLQLLTSLSFLHSCLRLDHIAGRSYLIHPESLPSVFPACAHPAFQMPATTAVQESWLNPFSTHVESRRRVSLQTKTGCRSIRVAPKALTLECVGIMCLCLHHTFTKMERWTKEQSFWDPLPGLSMLSEVLCNLIFFLFIVSLLLNISLIH